MSWLRSLARSPNLESNVKPERLFCSRTVLVCECKRLVKFKGAGGVAGLVLGNISVALLGSGEMAATSFGGVLVITTGALAPFIDSVTSAGSGALLSASVVVFTAVAVISMCEAGVQDKKILPSITRAVIATSEKPTIRCIQVLL